MKLGLPLVGFLGLFVMLHSLELTNATKKLWTDFDIQLDDSPMSSDYYRKWRRQNQPTMAWRLRTTPTPFWRRTMRNHTFWNDVDEPTDDTISEALLNITSVYRIPDVETLFVWNKLTPQDYLRIDSVRYALPMFVLNCRHVMESRFVFAKIRSITLTSVLRIICDKTWVKMKKFFEISFFEETHTLSIVPLTIQSQSNNNLLLCFNATGHRLFEINLNSSGLAANVSSMNNGTYACTVRNAATPSSYANFAIFTAVKDVQVASKNLMVFPISIDATKDSVKLNLYLAPSVPTMIWMLLLQKNNICVHKKTLSCSTCRSVFLSDLYQYCRLPLQRSLQSFTSSTQRSLLTNFGRLSPNTEYTLLWLAANDSLFREIRVFRRDTVWTRGVLNSSLSPASIGATWVVLQSNMSSTNSYFMVSMLKGPTYLMQEQRSINITGLKPNSKYQFSWSQKDGNRWIDIASIINVTTKPQPPTPPQSVQEFVILQNSIFLKWKPPMSINGRNVSYVVECQGKSRIRQETNITSIIMKTPDSSWSVFVCTVIARNEAGDSDASVPLIVFNQIQLIHSVSVDAINQTHMTLSWATASVQQHLTHVGLLMRTGNASNQCFVPFPFSVGSSAALVKMNLTICPVVQALSAVQVVDDTFMRVTLDNLNFSAVSKYNFTFLLTNSNGFVKLSQAYAIQFAYQDVTIQVASVDWDSISVRVGSLSSNKDFANPIQVALMHDDHEESVRLLKQPDNVFFNKLDATTVYSIQVRQMYNSKWFCTHTLPTVSTKMKRPSKLLNVSLISMNESSALMSWLPPSENVTQYQVKCVELGQKILTTQQPEIQIDLTNHVRLTCMVAAVNQAGAGNWSELISLFSDFSFCYQNTSTSQRDPHTMEVTILLNSTGCRGANGFIVMVTEVSNHSVRCVMIQNLLFTFDEAFINRGRLEDMVPLISAKCPMPPKESTLIVPDDADQISFNVESNGTQDYVFHIFMMDNKGAGDFTDVKAHVADFNTKESDVPEAVLIVVGVLLCLAAVGTVGFIGYKYRRRIPMHRPQFIYRGQRFDQDNEPDKCDLLGNL